MSDALGFSPEDAPKVQAAIEERGRADLSALWLLELDDGQRIVLSLHGKPERADFHPDEYLADGRHIVSHMNVAHGVERMGKRVRRELGVTEEPAMLRARQRRSAEPCRFCGRNPSSGSRFNRR